MGTSVDALRECPDKVFDPMWFQRLFDLVGKDNCPFLHGLKLSTDSK